MTSTHFIDGGDRYARFRPRYPAAVANLLADLAPRRALALDIGCGSGQISDLLAARFQRVRASDISADQIANATPDPRIDYVVEPAERIGVDDGTADLIVAAQAAHWFDLARFHGEARRVAVAGGIVALVSYGIMTIDGGDGDVSRRFERFYHQQIARFWPAERRHVEAGYATLDFPYDELPAPALAIERAWTLPALIGYIRTWSAVRRARTAGTGAMVADFETDLAGLWGAPGRTRRLAWPIAMRIGRV